MGTPGAATVGGPPTFGSMGTGVGGGGFGAAGSLNTTGLAPSGGFGQQNTSLFGAPAAAKPAFGTPAATGGLFGTTTPANQTQPSLFGSSALQTPANNTSLLTTNPSKPVQFWWETRKTLIDSIFSSSYYVFCTFIE